VEKNKKNYTHYDKKLNSIIFIAKMRGEHVTPFYYPFDFVIPPP